MALAITAITPLRAGTEGGHMQTLTGSFPLLTPMTAQLIAPNGVVLNCLSGVPGSPTTLMAPNATTMTLYTPTTGSLPYNTYTVQVTVPSTGQTASFPGLAMRPAMFKSETYGLRGVAPPTWAVGPRTLVSEAFPVTLRSTP